MADPLPPDDNRALPGLSIYLWLGCGVATVIVAIRLITRLVSKQVAGWDDFFIGVSYLTALVLYVGTGLLLSHGYGHHIYYVSRSDLIILLKLNIVVTNAGFASLAFARTSIGLFLLRLVTRFRSWSWVVYFGLALNTVQAVTLIILTGVRCVPVQKTWDPDVSGFCINPKRFTAADRFLGCLNVVVDLIFALFPLVIIRKLQIQRKIRLAIYLLLSCGLLTAVASIGRVVASDYTVEDVTWDMVPLTYWALSEMSGVLILSCMPAMRQLFDYTKNIQKARAYVHSKLTGSKNQSMKPEGRTKDTDSRKDFLFPPAHIRMQKDVYVELSDRGHDGEATPRYIGLGQSSYRCPAQEIAEIV